MDAGESAEEALFREVQEEVGISRVNLRMVEKRGPYRYRYPLAHRKSQKWEGQEQTYFLCDFLGQDRDFCLDSHGEQEFSSVRWIDPQQFSRSWLPDFKVEVYEQVFRDFFGAELRS
ncbi:MAG: NUDIX domain-containing protein [Verrucomicrobiota bacterium]